MYDMQLLVKNNVFKKNNPLKAPLCILVILLLFKANTTRELRSAKIFFSNSIILL
jgi:hypothetical protein